MTAALRELTFLAAAAALSWWFLLRAPGAVQAPPPLRVVVDVLAGLEAEVSGAPDEADPQAVAPVASGFASERGAPDTDGSGVGLGEAGAATDERTTETPANAVEASAPDSPEDADVVPAATGELLESEAHEIPAAAESNVDDAADPDPGRADAAELAADAELLAAARAEFSGEAARGFETVLLASPEDQLDLARTFGEELVLVPRATLDPDAADAHHFRLALGAVPRVERVDGRPDLERYRPYRDLFDYEYARLPAPLRELRRRAGARDDVYLFAALIPAPEWALVVGRRREVLARLGLALEDVRRFTLRYRRDSAGRFDVVVEEVELVDGRRHRPNP